MPSTWRQDRNDAARARLSRALPAVFPRAVLVHAHARSLVPPLPRLAVESYWRTHPLRADRLARALAARGDAPADWRWVPDRGPGRAPGFRTPPAPFRDAEHGLGPGHCCICGQPVFRFGWHRDLWGEGAPNRRAAWHACCVAAWKLWIDPRLAAPVLRRLQRRRCGVSGGRLWRTAEVDHRVPLHLVWHRHADTSWPALLDYWGLPNLQLVNRDIHAEKSGREAGERARRRGTAAGRADAPS